MSKSILFNVDNGTIIFEKKNNENFIHLENSEGLFRGTINNFPAKWGNYWYTRAKEAAKHGYYGAEFMFDTIFFDSCALHNDYDFFSDVYKDLNNVRPHYTKEQWEERVRLAKSHIL